MWKRCVLSSLALGVMALAAGCGGGDSGGQPVVPNPPPTIMYSVGGSVTGSSGPVALRNSNGDTVNVAAAGSFSFGTALVSGTSYAVTVTTPPAGQTCTVANGSGNIAASSVTNIVVNCVTPGITVGGVVAGLSAGRSVTLRVLGDGASESLTVAANGRYDFAHNFSPDAEYIVLVFTQPLDQSCTVDNFEGALSGASVVNVIVTCVDTFSSARRWTTPAEVIHSVSPVGAELPTAQRPRVAYDANGNGIAVWQYDALGAPQRIFWSRYTPAGGWTSPASLNDPLSFDQYSRPEVAMAANGRTIVTYIWNGNITADIYTPGSGWSGPTWIDFQPAGTTPMLALDTEVRPYIDNAGNALIVWEQEIRPIVSQTGNDPNPPPPPAFSRKIHYNRYTPGTGWASSLGDLGRGAIPVKQILTAFQQNPQLAVNAQGRAIVTWAEYTPGTLIHDLWSREYDIAANTWGPAQIVEEANAWQIHQSAVVIDDAGVATALWLDYDGTRFFVKSSRTANGVWAASAILESDNPDTRGRASYPRAVVDSEGEVLAVWTQSGQEEGNYVSRRYTPGVGWRAEQVIGPFHQQQTDADFTRIVLRGNANGDAVAVWSRCQGIGAENVLLPFDIVANEYNGTTHEWGAPKVLDKADSTGNDLPQYNYEGIEPDVAITPDGDAVAVWEKVNHEVGDNGIRTSRYE
jgi:hypothetical protein